MSKIRVYLQCCSCSFKEKDALRLCAGTSALTSNESHQQAKFNVLVPAHKLQDIISLDLFLKTQ